MKLALAIAAIPLVLILALLSVPWVALALGFAVIGENEAAEHVADTMPLVLWLNYVEGTRCPRH